VDVYTYIHVGIRGISNFQGGSFVFPGDRPGDVILKVNGIAVNTEADFLNNIDQAKVSGDVVELTVMRNLDRSVTGATGSSSGNTNNNFKEIILKLKF
jgi:S1-C subfamily serine protease